MAHNRRVSRSNSTTSSATTITAIANQSSRSGTRTSNFVDRPTTSDSSATARQQLKNGNAPPQRLDTNPLGSNMNINRWSYSSTSSTPVPEDYLPQTLTSSKPIFDSRDRVTNGTAVPKSQYSTTRADKTTTARSPKKSPQRSRGARQPSPAPAPRTFYGNEGSSSATSTSNSVSRIPAPNVDDMQDYFGGTWEHRTGINKYGQPVQGVAVQYGPGHSRPRETEILQPVERNLQPTGASHIGLQKKPSHKRHREDGAQGSKGTAEGGSMSSVRSDQSRRGHRSPTQKNMLSKALSKANAAVLEDNAQNIPGAIEAYIEACELLQQVMMRSGDTDDRLKLEAIHSTYSNRIAELHDLDDSFGYLIDKELPDHPPNDFHESQDEDTEEEDEERKEEDGYEYIMDVQAYPQESQTHLRPELQPPRSQVIPPRQESLLPQIFGGSEYTNQNINPNGVANVSSQSNLRRPMDSQYMPPPLSPRRPPTPPFEENEHPPPGHNVAQATTEGLQIQQNSGSTSWLDTFDESASSPGSSRLSSFDFGPKDGKLVSEIEAEFDAMNKAAEMAYESDASQGATPRPGEENEALEAQHHVIQDLVQSPPANAPDNLPQQSERRYNHLTREYLDSEAEEEEELLEMMMQEGYGAEFAKVDQTVKPAIPRQSDSSGFSGRSSERGWESSIASTAATSGTTLSTLAENPEMAHPTVPPPEVPSHTTSPAKQPTMTVIQGPSNPEKHVGLRDRRFSGQSTRQLKIETYSKRSSAAQQQRQGGPATANPALEMPPTQLIDVKQNASGSSLPNLGLPLTPLASVSGNSTPSETPVISTTQKHPTPPNVDENNVVPPSPGRLAKMMPPPPRKNISSSSLRPKNLSVTTTEVNDLPATPGSAVFPAEFKRVPSATTPSITPTNQNVLTSAAMGGMYLFDDLAMPNSPSNYRSPNTVEPTPLEPCPNSFLLRPFWLMRCLYQVLAHPRGGYVSTKLFIPRDIWRVKNIKLKALDDKIAQCDMLTAALLKLAKVDTLDADAVLEELQSFEMILDQARTGLQKKLGSDVGVAGSASVFKSSPAADDTEPHSGKGSGTSAARSLASSWRKLRSKSSTAALTPGNNLPRGEIPSNLTMPSLPMIENVVPSTSRSYRQNRHPPPTPSAVPYIPAQHANYMSSLARLFDSVQVLDAIARQVEDPGLKATNQTQVGLEFSIRNAAEFFAFFIIRFALADIGLLIDKYLKRGTEWATA